MTAKQHLAAALPPQPGHNVVRLRAGTTSPAFAHVQAQRQADDLRRAARAGWEDGYTQGLRHGDRTGFMRGYLGGALVGLLVGAVLVAGALALGLNVPPLWG